MVMEKEKLFDDGKIAPARSPQGKARAELSIRQPGGLSGELNNKEAMKRRIEKSQASWLLFAVLIFRPGSW